MTSHVLRACRLAALLLMALPGSEASLAAVSCGVSATSVSETYSAEAALTMDGSIIITCTRSNADPQIVPLYIGINQPATGREMAQQGGTDRLPYAVYRTRPNIGLWTDGPGLAEGSAGAGGLLTQLDFMSPGALVAQRVVPFYAHVPAGLNRHVGWYQDPAVAISVQSGSGESAASTLVSVGARIADQCRVASPPAPLDINYTAFMASPAQGSALFNVTCTLGTAYTIALDPPAATMDAVDISYQLSLDAASGQGSAQAQTFRITGTAAPGQPGRCGASTCRASRTHSIVVTY